MSTTGTSLRPSATEVELASQPDLWARAIAEASTTTPVLPAAGTPVLFVGCGTSYYIGESYARRRMAAGLGRTRACIASEIPYVDADETVVVLSRSGTTKDVADVAAQLRGEHRVIGLVGVADSPIAAACHDVVLLDYADEQSVVQTRFATTALTVLRASLGEDLSRLPGQGRAALDLPLPAHDPQHTVFLGRGPTIGLAQEAALKCREAAGAWTEAYAIMEYEHGPISVAGPQSLIWSLTPVPDVVARSIAATGATVLAPDLDGQAQLPAVHRLAVRLAAAAGRDPDRPTFLSRSVDRAS